MQMVDFAKAFEVRYPREVVIAVVRDAKGKRYNPITLGMFTHVSFEPPVLAIAINRSNYSLGLIQEAKEFVVAIASVKMNEQARVWGEKSGRDCDKFAMAPSPTSRASKVDSLLLLDAAANFECKLIGEASAGEHVVLLGEVVASHRAEGKVERLFITGPGHAMGPWR